MTDASTGEHGSPSPRIRVGLAGLEVADMPSLEILVLDEIANWIFSPENPGKQYSGEQGGAVVTAVLSAVRKASDFRPEQTPPPTPAMEKMRVAVVNGVNQIGGTPDALSLFVITLMPAVISELERRVGDAASQCYWLYCYSLLVLAGGRTGDLNHELMPGIVESFDGWNELMSAGYALPWRVAAV